MPLLPRLASLWRNLFRRDRVEQELTEEVQAYLELLTEEKVKEGLGPAAARRAALIELGGVEQIKERVREIRMGHYLETIGQDLGFGARMLRKNPGFTIVALTSLALGIGACTAIFSIVNGVLLRSLPVPNPQELRVLQWTGTDSRIPSLNDKPVENGNRVTAYSVSHPMFLSLREAGAAQADIFGFIPIEDVAVRARGDAFAASGLMVSDNFFPGLGVRPLIGRLFAAGDDGAGATPTVVITYDWWEKHFARDPGVLGQAVALNGGSSTIIGVLPRAFAGVIPGERRDFYVPMSARAQFFKEPFQSFTSDRHWWVRLMARLQPATSDAQLQAALTAIFARQAGEVLNEPEIRVEPGHAGLAIDRNNYRKPLLLMLGVVGLVMLVACANLAGLSLARGAARQHELAVRAALGASRWHLIRQSLAESLLLALLGGGLGVLMSLWGRGAISRLLAGSGDGLRYDLSLDLLVLGFGLAIALVTALLSGLLPALRAGRVDPLDGLKTRGALGAPRLRAGKILVIAQISLSLLLLSGAGLYLRTLVNLRHIDAGFRTERLLVFQVNPAAVGYKDARLAAFYEQVQNSLAALPGVEAATFVQYPLLNNMGWSVGFGLPGHAPGPPEGLRAHRLVVGEQFFATMGIPILQGRGFSVSDTDSAAKVIVVNEAFTRQYLPGENPMGQAVKIFGVDWQIVGVCGDAKYRNIKGEVPATVYNSFRQYPIRYSTCFTVRTAVPPLALATAVRKAVAEIDPAVPVANLTTQEQLRDGNISQERLLAMLCGALAGLALLLSCIGLYGLMAYYVARRRGEIAIRMAVGASPGVVARAILHDALVLAAIGIGIGLPAALATTRLIKSQLYGVAPNDPVTLVIVAVTLVTVALLAAWFPARRAMKVDPMVALRHE
ncbi:MAG TPA: ABC transporter permease [Blastocatellia bacterium]|nr:ABC transporter permease [Blastocatellia bacterium]